MISKFLAALLVLFMSASAMATSVSFLWGDNFREDLGYEKEKLIMTIEHFGLWEYGTVFFYYDITEPFSEENGDNAQFFGSLAPSFSSSKIFGVNYGSGLLRDIQLRLEVENGSGNGANAFRNYFYGLQFDLAVPGFDFISFIPSIRDNPADAGFGYQFLTFWQMSHEWSRWRRFKFTGFVATSPWEGDVDRNAIPIGADPKGRFLSAQPQLLWDLGYGLWGKQNRLETGIEYAYFLNRYLFSHKDEKVVQALLKLSW